MSHPVHTDFQPAIPKTRSFSEAVRAELEQICARYPKREAALLPALRLLEREFGMVDPPGMIHVADLLGVSPAKVFGVFSFYTHYRRPTDGQYVFQVCSTLSCAMGGSEGITDHLCHKLGIPVGGTTADGMFSVKKVECLANCDQAPTLQVNDDFVDRVTPADCDRMIAEARAAGPAFPAAKDYHPVGYRPPAQVYHLPEHAAKGKGMLLNHALEAGSTPWRTTGRGAAMRRRAPCTRANVRPRRSSTWSCRPASADAAAQASPPDRSGSSSRRTTSRATS